MSNSVLSVISSPALKTLLPRGQPTLYPVSSQYRVPKGSKDVSTYYREEFPFVFALGACPCPKVQPLINHVNTFCTTNYNMNDLTTKLFKPLFKLSPVTFFMSSGNSRPFAGFHSSHCIPIVDHICIIHPNVHRGLSFDQIEGVVKH
jgi:hypothetical protein